MKVKASLHVNMLNSSFTCERESAIGINTISPISIDRSKLHSDMDGYWTYRYQLPLPAVLWNYRQRL